jgi:hypothetical protein
MGMLSRARLWGNQADRGYPALKYYLFDVEGYMLLDSEGYIILVYS